MPGASGKIFCFGLGYSAMALADRLHARGWAVAGTCRTDEKADILKKRGIEAMVFNGVRAEEPVAVALAKTTHLLVSVPPNGKTTDSVLAHYRDDIIAAPNLIWVGYLSTTGVYGDHRGDWVDEDTPPNPTNQRGGWRVAAERAWLELGRKQPGLAVHIFRLAGIYGPGRNALETVRAGRARRTHKPGQLFGRIHVADVATVLEASMNQPNPGRIYNVCDDEPAPPEQVVEYACQLLGVTPPPLIPFAEANLSPMARSFYQDNKRVRNQRIKEELGVTLHSPNYRIGLKELLT